MIENNLINSLTLFSLVSSISLLISENQHKIFNWNNREHKGNKIQIQDFYSNTILNRYLCCEIRRR